MSRHSKLVAASPGINLPSWASLTCAELLALSTGTKTERAVAALVAEEAAIDLLPSTSYKHVAPESDVMETFSASLAAARAEDWCVPPLTSPPASPMARIYVPPPGRLNKKKHRAVAQKHTTNAESWKQFQAASNGGQAHVRFQAFAFGKDQQVVGRLRLKPPITGNSHTDLVSRLVYDAMISGVNTTAKVTWTAASADGDEEEDHPAWCDEIEDPRAPEAWDPCG